MWIYIDSWAELSQVMEKTRLKDCGRGYGERSAWMDIFRLYPEYSRS